MRSDAGRALGAIVVTWVRDLARLVVPVECPGCGRHDETLCDTCAGSLNQPVRRCEADVPRLDRMDRIAPLPVWAVAGYSGAVRGIVVAWKDRGRADLTPVVVASAQRAGRAVGARLRGGVGPDPVDVVPVPSSLAARRRRGADLVGLLAAGVVRGLGDAGVGADLAPVLRRRSARDQVGLGARARGRNTSGSFALRRTHADRAGRLHLLVDDVVTTGSTLAVCEREITSRGGLVLGAVVLAATPAPQASRRDRDVAGSEESTKEER